MGGVHHGLGWGGEGSWVWGHLSLGGLGHPTRRRTTLAFKERAAQSGLGELWGGAGVGSWGQTGRDKPGECIWWGQVNTCVSPGFVLLAALSPHPLPSPMQSYTLWDLWPIFSRTYLSNNDDHKGWSCIFNSLPHGSPLATCSSKCLCCPFIDGVAEAQRPPSFLK